MKEIGGYPELELNMGREYHPDALKLNSGRHALWYAIKAYSPRKIYLPYYICNSVLEPIEKMNIKYQFYSIDENFKPIMPFDLEEKDFFLYVNYFGINNTNVRILSKEIKNLITDNSQAFFTFPIKYPTFYSPRKFFGVPDGGYLYTDKLIDYELDHAISHDKCMHLIKRLDLEAQQGYDDYKTVEELFSHEPIKLMSHLTQKILNSIDYEKVQKIRKQNFSYLHSRLKELNELNINNGDINGPLKYPLLIKNDGLKVFLIKNKIYISTYWNEVLERVEKKSFEYYLTKYLIPLPIDQRYNQNDMDMIVKKINDKIG